MEKKICFLTLVWRDFRQEEIKSSRNRDYHKIIILSLRDSFSWGDGKSHRFDVTITGFSWGRDRKNSSSSIIIQYCARDDSMIYYCCCCLGDPTDGGHKIVFFEGKCDNFQTYGSRVATSNLAYTRSPPYNLLCQNPSKSVKIRRNPSKSIEIRRNPTKSVEIRWNPLRIRQNPSKSVKNPLKSVEIRWNPSKSVQRRKRGSLPDD